MKIFWGADGAKMRWNWEGYFLTSPYGTDHEFDALEQQVNAWLEENRHVVVLSRHVVGATGGNAVGKGFVNCTIVIFYKTWSARSGAERIGCPVASHHEMVEKGRFFFQHKNSQCLTLFRSHARFYLHRTAVPECRTRTYVRHWPWPRNRVTGFCPSPLLDTVAAIPATSPWHTHQVSRILGWR